jgi:hypothetical protein
MKEIYSKFIEIHKNRYPNWANARKIISKASEIHRIELEEALMSIVNAWENKGYNIKRFDGRFTVILVAMNRAEEKYYHEVVDMLLFVKSGMAKAAGFLPPK